MILTLILFFLIKGLKFYYVQQKTILKNRSGYPVEEAITHERFSQDQRPGGQRTSDALKKLWLDAMAKLEEEEKMAKDLEHIHRYCTMDREKLLKEREILEKNAVNQLALLTATKDALKNCEEEMGKLKLSHATLRASMAKTRDENIRLTNDAKKIEEKHSKEIKHIQELLLAKCQKKLEECKTRLITEFLPQEEERIKSQFQKKLDEDEKLVNQLREQIKLQNTVVAGLKTDKKLLESKLADWKLHATSSRPVLPSSFATINEEEEEIPAAFATFLINENRNTESKKCNLQYPPHLQTTFDVANMTPAVKEHGHSHPPEHTHKGFATSTPKVSRRAGSMLDNAEEQLCKLLESFHCSD